MFRHDFVRNAYLAGTLIALSCGLVGHFLAMRRQVFAGDALSHAAFTGALAAVALGEDARLGLFLATALIAVGMGALGARARPDDAVIGSVLAWILGVGALLLSIIASGSSGSNGVAGVRILFGSIFGLTVADARLAAAIGACVSLVVLVIARPLLFCSVDGAVAAAGGVPVRLLGGLFLILLGLTAAEATQAVGALLLLGLLAAPAGAAHLLTPRPYLALVLSGLLAVGCLWVGLALAYAVHRLPPSTAIVGVAVAVYLAAWIGASAGTGRGGGARGGGARRFIRAIRTGAVAAPNDHPGTRAPARIR